MVDKSNYFESHYLHTLIKSSAGELCLNFLPLWQSNVLTYNDITNLKKVTNILDKNSVHYDQLGKIIDKELIINSKTKVTIDELKSYNTNWLNNYMN